MGLGVARSLLREGFAVHACDVRKEVLDQFAGEGGIACDSPGQLAENCEIVVIVVVNAAQTDAVLFGPEGAFSRLRTGSVVVVCATVDTVFALDLGKRLAERTFRSEEHTSKLPSLIRLLSNDLCLHK